MREQLPLNNVPLTHDPRRYIHETGVDLPDGCGVFLAVGPDLTVSLAVGTKLRATLVTMTEQDLREVINRCRETLHFLTAQQKE